VSRGLVVLGGSQGAGGTSCFHWATDQVLLCERSLLVQLPPKQVQLLLLELLLTAHHVYDHAAARISIRGRCQAWRAVPRPVADSLLQLGQRAEQILSHCGEHS